MLAELAAAVRSRAISAEELVRRSLERIERLDRPINSVVLIRVDAALDEARALDRSIASGELAGPLAGLPVLVKDSEDVAGLPTTFASLLRAEAPPAARDCEQVVRLRSAGAIVVGKTNLPEFAVEGFTDNRLFGPTRNPWSREWTPGGSSGGSGAALAMGLAPIATGTDGGGSVRIPAAFCGLIGLKPTNGLIGRDPIPSWIDLSTKGPLASSAADARLLLEVLKGPVAGDPSAHPGWAARDDAGLSRIVATPRMSDQGPLPRGVAASWERALADLAAVTQVAVELIEPPFSTDLDDDWFTLIAVEERTWVGGEELDERADELTEYARFASEHARRTSVEDYVAARRRRFEMVKLLDELLEGDAVLVAPTMCEEGFLFDGRMPNGQGSVTAGAYNTTTANMTGHPALSLPAGRSANGVPFGLMVTGPRFADDVLLTVAEQWESAHPWPRTAPGFEPFDT
jgi:Asp-tRNA(Asn)/Glu-tRNA(Gln) amidotransferase A subunit family amidase